jgi:glycosyltransferase involved in cell wall biosynthesis
MAAPASESADGQGESTAPGEAAKWPSVSIIIPCRNEASYIGHCLDSILASEYPQDRIEVIIAEGMSDDGTREIIARYSATHPQIKMVDNPRRITPAALNAAIRATTGQVIVRMDAHGIFPTDYVSRLVTALEETGADNVGGTITTLPGADTAIAKAIAIGLSHPLGVGNSHHRVGVSTRRLVDFVPYGCWRRTVFERLGLFDEELPRDQDVEFDLRLLRSGGRIMMLPEVNSRYHARKKLGQVGRMLYQYGYYKPLVARKIGRILTLRQLVPPIFLVLLVGTALLGLWSALAAAGFAVIAGAYLGAIASCAFLAGRVHGERCGLALLAVFPVMHLGYGWGYIRGVVDHLIFARRVVPPPVLTR